MAKACSETPACRRKTPSKHYFLLITIFAALFFLLHIHITSSPEFIHEWRQALMTTNCSQELQSKLREAVTFLPLKDLRYASKALQGHTWFMSSTLDTHENGEVQFQQFPSKGRILCLKGRDTHDGSWNSYALAWPHALPPNATFLNGLTFVSYNHYNYDNIWHGLSAAVPFVAWHIRNKCAAPPRRWILYHRGELRTKMGPWLSSLMEAAFGEPLNVERFDVVGGGNETSPACFEKAVVMRHNEGGMSRERRLQVYDFLRCRARVFCNVSVASEVSEKGIPVIGMTMFMRTGPRSFSNQTAVIGIFSNACREVAGCRLTVAYANNLTFCQQVIDQLHILTNFNFDNCKFFLTLKK